MPATSLTWAASTLRRRATTPTTVAHRPNRRQTRPPAPAPFAATPSRSVCSLARANASPRAFADCSLFCPVAHRSASWFGRCPASISTTKTVWTPGCSGAIRARSASSTSRTISSRRHRPFSECPPLSESACIFFLVQQEGRVCSGVDAVGGWEVGPRTDGRPRLLCVL